MPDSHAKVTASGSHRWLNCPGSVQLESLFPDTSSEAAAEGTKAHAIAEAKLKAWIKDGSRREFELADETMQQATSDYRDYVIELYNSLEASLPDLEVEVRLDLSDWIPKGFGTSDACIISTDCLHIIDFKYGKGVRVDAADNSQMRLYALGAVALYLPLYEFDKVKTHIYQPRLSHVSTEEISVRDLLEWGESIKPTARKAFDGCDERHSGKWCEFCRARQECKTRAREMFEVLEAKPNQALLSPDDVAGYLPKLHEAIKWAKELQDYALCQARSGTKYPGYKLVEGRSVRKVRDQDALGNALVSAGYEADKVWKPKEIQTLTNLEKLVGEKKLADKFRDYFEKPKGKPVLVPESDKRKEWADLPPDEMFENV